MKHQKSTSTIILTIIVVVLGLAVLFPFFWMVRSSFMSNIEIYKYPPLLLPTTGGSRTTPIRCRSFRPCATCSTR